MVTIGDVARHAGVSRSTVSYALSGNRPIKPETRERIQRAVRELGFTANAGARALATARTSILGLVVPFASEEFAPATLGYVLSVSENARSHGYDVLLVTRQEGDAGIARITGSGLVDGLLVLDVQRQDARIPSLLRARQPAVLLGLPDDDVSVDQVDLDFAAAGRVLVERLHAEGHREIVFLTLPLEVFDQDLGYAWRVREAVRSTAAAHGMVVREVEGATEPTERARRIGAVLDQRGAATALLVHNDGALVDLPLLFRERGIRVPEDLSVVTLYPDRFGRMFSLPFTAIETSASEIAARAVQMLIERIDQPHLLPRRELLEPVLVDRGSSAAAH